MSTPRNIPQLDSENPWPGLAAFDENARAFFHGRDKEAELLFKRVIGTPVTVLYGRSGLGKTSLLRAGLFPLLREHNFLPIYVRFELEPGAAELADQVRAAICEVIREQVPDGMLPAEDESAWEFLHRSDFELWSAQNYPLTPVIVLDQFEELFTLGEGVPDLVDAFKSDLGNLVENRIPANLTAGMNADPSLAGRFRLRSRNYKLLISLREDFFADLEGWRRVMPSLTESRMRLHRLKIDEAVDAVYTPAAAMWDQPSEVSGASTGSQSGRELARRVVSIIAGEGLRRGDELNGSPQIRPGAAEVEPALLSLFCSELNEERKKRGKSRFDGQLIEEAQTDVLANYYASCVGDMPPRVAEFIESELITEKGFRNSYPRDEAVSWEDPVPSGHLTDDELTRLIRLRLLRIEERYGTPSIELTHDVLTGVVREQRDRRRAEAEKAALARAAAEREAELEEEKERQKAQLQEAKKLADVEREGKERAQLLAGKLSKQTRTLRALVAVALVIALFGGWEWLKAAKQLYAATSLQLSASGQSSSTLKPRWQYESIQKALAADTLADDDGPLHIFRLLRLLPFLNGATEDLLQVAHANAENALFNTAVSTRGLEKIRRLPRLETDRSGPSPSMPFLSGDKQHVVDVDPKRCAATVWRITTPDPIGQVEFDSQNCRLTESSDAKRIWAAGSKDGTVQAKLASSGDWVGPKISTGQGVVSTVTLSNDEHWLYTGGTDGTVRVWDAATGQPRAVFYDHGATVTQIMVSSDNRRVISESAGHVRVWDFESGTLIGKPIDFDPLQSARGDSLSVSSADGHRIATSGRAGVQVWDADSGAKLPFFEGNQSAAFFRQRFVTALAFTPDGDNMLIASADNTSGIVQNWALKPDFGAAGEPILVGEPVFDLAFGNDSHHFFLTTASGVIREWKSDEERTLANSGPFASAAISEDGSRIATARGDQPTIQVWDGASGQRVGTEIHSPAKVTALALDKTGNRVVSGADDGSIQAWDVDSGREDGVPIRAVRKGKASAIAFSPDGREVAVGGTDGTVAFWDWKADPPRQVGDTILAARQAITSIAISPNGRQLAVGLGAPIGKFRDDDKRIYSSMVQVWDAETRTEVTEISTGYATSLAFDETGKWIIAGSSAGDMTAWSAVTGRQFSEPMKIARPVQAKAASKQSASPLATPQTVAALASPTHKVVVLGDSGTVETWPAPSSLRDQLCDKLWVNMTEREWAMSVSEDIDSKTAKVCPSLMDREAVPE